MSLISDLVPLLVKALKHICILVLVRYAIAQGCIMDSQGIMAMPELHACIIADKRLLKNGASRLYSLVIYRQADESYVRHHMVGTDLIWIECIESVGRSHVDASVRSLEKGIRDGMAASESVTGREHLYIVS